MSNVGGRELARLPPSDAEGGLRLPHLARRAEVTPPSVGRVGLGETGKAPPIFAARRRAGSPGLAIAKSGPLRRGLVARIEQGD